MNHKEYLDTLKNKNKKQANHEMKRIQSKSHQIGPYKINKKSGHALI